MFLGCPGQFLPRAWDLLELGIYGFFNWGMAVEKSAGVDGFT